MTQKTDIHPCLTRHADGPVLTPQQVPYPSTLTFNVGVVKFQGRYVCVFRNDWGDMRNRKEPWGMNLGLATSEDGIEWTVAPAPCFQWKNQEVLCSYDPRLTVLDGRCYMSFSIDTRHGIRSGLAVTDDFKAFELLYLSVPDNRNVVLFPERQGGRIMRFERPFPVYGRTEPERFDIWFAQSPDGRFWGEHQFVLGVEHVPWANCKIGPGTPPIRTEQGWLSLFHAVDVQDGVVYPSWRDQWTKRYTAGVMLTDLREPWRVIGLSRKPVLVPETEYEQQGYRGSVVFPCSMVPEDDGTVKVYYGAADTVTGLATGRVDDLLALCEPLEVAPLPPPDLGLSN